MSRLDDQVMVVARDQRWLITRAQVLALGGTDRVIHRRVTNGDWIAIQRGVYLVSRSAPNWHQRVLGACLVGGGGCVASHRAALRVYGCDGFERVRPEVLVPMTERTAPAHTISHRTRRLDPEEVRTYDGIPVTSFPRSLLDAGRFATPLVLEKALECGVRRGLSTEHAVAAHARARIRIPGALTLLEVLGARDRDHTVVRRASSAELELLEALAQRGVEEPTRQHRVELRSGTPAFLDLAWPAAMVAVEVDGVDAHSGREALESDLVRQNHLLDLGWQLRRWTGTQVRRHPEAIVQQIDHLLATARTAPGR